VEKEIHKEIEKEKRKKSKVTGEEKGIPSYPQGIHRSVLFSASAEGKPLTHLFTYVDTCLIKSES